MYAGGKREEGADVEENRPGFHSGQTGLWEQGQHQEARGRSGRVPVIRENGGGGRRRAHSFISPQRSNGGVNSHKTAFFFFLNNKISTGHAVNGGGRKQDGQKEIKTV